MASSLLRVAGRSGRSRSINMSRDTQQTPIQNSFCSRGRNANIFILRPVNNIVVTHSPILYARTLWQFAFTSQHTERFKESMSNSLWEGIWFEPRQGMKIKTDGFRGFVSRFRSFSRYYLEISYKVFLPNPHLLAIRKRLSVIFNGTQPYV